ncbi:MAG: NAD(P)H-quinone oxidoreductase subunit 2, chloroplastic [Turneriella sp.]|nr:NAD(P)H-quinone oxidoreductase subunit 2, chloroplastic [Turneriella sp.]
MIVILTLLVFSPLFLSLFLFLIPIKNERILSILLQIFNVINTILTIIFLCLYILTGFQNAEFTLWTFSQAGEYSFKLQFLVDRYSVSFQTLIALLSGIVFMFSRRYMHREIGYRRFFVSLLLFRSGISLVALANNIEMLYAGWEMVGLSSFLLIGFYQSRKGSGRHALRVFTIYRFCDVGLFIGAWLFHELGGEFSFFSMSQSNTQIAHLTQESLAFTIIGFLVLFAAIGKSAQYPFTFWVPRAMKGPTPSSAIFYGALSIHAGVFLLIRMYPLWHAIPAIQIATGIFGGITLVTASLSAKAQSNIKGQIGYASVAQVGVMFVELAFGLRDVALFHFMGNAILRCYQLLASPSVLVIFLRMQNEGMSLSGGVTGFITRFTGKKFSRILYAIAFSECYGEYIVNLLLKALKAFARFASRVVSYQFSILVLVLLLTIVILENQFPTSLAATIIRVTFGLLAVYLALAAFGENKTPTRLLNNAALSSLLTGLSTLFLAPESFRYTILFFLGIASGYLLTRVALYLLPSEELKLSYQGLTEKYPSLIFLMLVGILSLSGFTLTPTFLGEDLLLHYGAGKFVFETFIVAGTFILNGVTLMRMYVKLAYGRN